MYIVGLTGGIGSGKTAASDIFKSLGVNIVDADIVAREVVEPGQAALAEITKYFGKDILLPDNSLDRAKLRLRIFQDPEAKAWLEQLLHPIIRKEIQEQLINSDSAYSILVSPLLFETDQSSIVNRILLIDVPVNTQLVRAAERDSNSLEQIQKIIDSQLPRDVKLSKADDIICNDQSLLDLEAKIKDKHAFYLEQAHEHNS
tara:strand:- start:4943 stop:5548 length:606 start_codon:yes stop_codon:yes gene_type:complete